ncbi:hypothetical protein AKJ09_01510 [Labilithrix luteola]|uniref:Uncharacterized protein n=1 Tax=Labilithrix luteola TaxID=1391654 RepID=A0A0K1PN79_9BACT|nr:hypothetical protein AKJ09_01510 [Labilithrix luteola]
MDSSLPSLQATAAGTTAAASAAHRNIRVAFKASLLARWLWGP